MSAVMAICATPGCGRLYEKTSRRQHRCPADQAALDRQDNERRNSHVRRVVYDDPRWPHTRQVVFVRDNYTCADCGHFDPTGRDLVPDHDPFSVTELLEDFYNGLELALDPESCVTRCLICSGKKDGARSRG